MTRYEQGFMRKCAEYGVDQSTAVELIKRAYELGSISHGGVFRPIRSTADSFNPSDPDVSKVSDNGDVSGTLALEKAPNGRPGFIARASGLVSPIQYSGFVPDNEPRSVSDQQEGYRRSLLDSDGLLRRVPIVEDGQYNSTSWKDNKDLANLQSDAIRRRRGVGTPLVFNKKIKRYRLPE